MERWRKRGFPERESQARRKDHNGFLDEVTRTNLNTVQQFVVEEAFIHDWLSRRT